MSLFTDKLLKGRVDQHDQDITHILEELRYFRKWRKDIEDAGEQILQGKLPMAPGGEVYFTDLVEDFVARHQYVPAVPEKVTVIPAKPAEWKPLRPSHWDKKY